MYICLTSASGSPGVSTTALGLALRRAEDSHTLMVEADPVGSSPTLAGYLRSEVVHDRSLKNLINHDRHGRLREAFASQLVRIEDTNASVLPGLLHAGQAEPMSRTWEPLAELLTDFSAQSSVVVDAGRFGHPNGPNELLYAAEVIGIVIRPTLPRVAALSSALEPLKRQLSGRRSRASLGLIIIGSGFTLGSDAYDAADVAKATGVDVIATIPDSAKDARALSEGVRLGRWRRKRSAYIRALRGTWPKLEKFAETHRPGWLDEPRRSPAATSGGGR